jgi:putative transposase
MWAETIAMAARSGRSSYSRSDASATPHLLPGAVYHVTARGNDRVAVVRDDFDRRRLSDALATVVERFGWLCHAYCLMDNHYHLVVETPEATSPLECSSSTARMRSGSTNATNEADISSVGDEGHLLEACRYVVVNPLRAGICTRPPPGRGAAIGRQRASHAGPRS